MSTTPNIATEYRPSNSVTLLNVAHVRQNPGMYIGSTNPSGLHQVFFELLNSAVLEHVSGFCEQIEVTIHSDGALSICDHGRGFPIGINPETGRSRSSEAFSEYGALTKLADKRYRSSEQLYAMPFDGARCYLVINALSEYCQVEWQHDTSIHRSEFRQGELVSERSEQSSESLTKLKTRIMFKPDSEIFPSIEFDYQTIADRLRQTAYLNKKLSITFTDERSGRSEHFHYPQGLVNYLAELQGAKQVLHPALTAEVTVDGITAEVALQYAEGEDDAQVLCFTNNGINPRGGTQLTGFKIGLTLAVKAFGNANKLFPEGIQFKSGDFSTGLTAVINVLHPDPVYVWQLRSEVGNKELRNILSQLVYRRMSDYLQQAPEVGRVLCQNALRWVEVRRLSELLRRQSRRARLRSEDGKIIRKKPRIGQESGS
jgi:DNA gyrase subunit B